MRKLPEISLQRALDAGEPVTVTYSSGLQVIGVLEELLRDSAGQPCYLRTRGPTRLAWQDRVLPGHDEDYHSAGFGSPVGCPAGFDHCLSTCPPAELRQRGIVTQQRAELTYPGGITVAGTVSDLHREQERLLIIRFDDCTVTGPGDRLLFDPAWGCYDMAVGEALAGIEFRG